MANLDYSNKQYVKQSQLGIPIGNKVILGQLTSYTDGTAKWTYAKDTNPIIAGPGDRSTFTLYKDDNGKWNWTPTTSTSVSNLANREGFTEQQVKDSLYKTPQTQTVLNAGNVTQLGGIKEAQKLGVPGTTGKSTQVGTLPDTVSGNFAGQPDATTNAQQSATAEIPTKAAEVKIGEVASGTRTEFATNLRYPLSMSENQDFIKFTLVEFKPSTLSLGQGGGVSTFTRQGSTNPKGVVFLAIPGGISDTNSAGWGDDKMNPLEATLANVGLTAISQGMDSGMKVLGQTASNAASDSSTNQDAKTALQTAFAAAAMQGDAQRLLTRTTGAVFNPNLELLFTGPELRSFNFTFKMSARSKSEADMIIRIIRTFKQAMAPQRTASSIFVKAPLTFLISYHHKNEVHKRIGKIKECALLSLTTNYTPEGQYATYQDGTMVSYELQMQFKELEPVFNNDYTGPDTEIGY
jgi:hypothetical protein